LRSDLVQLIDGRLWIVQFPNEGHAQAGAAALLADP
jgi:hypothetical protein